MYQYQKYHAEYIKFFNKEQINDIPFKYTLGIREFRKHLTNKLGIDYMIKCYIEHIIEKVNNSKLTDKWKEIYINRAKNLAPLNTLKYELFEDYINSLIQTTIKPRYRIQTLHLTTFY